MLKAVSELVTEEPDTVCRGSHTDPTLCIGWEGDAVPAKGHARSVSDCGGHREVGRQLCLRLKHSLPIPAEADALLWAGPPVHHSHWTLD